jgi:HEAT repeat protein
MTDYSTDTPAPAPTAPAISRAADALARTHGERAITVLADLMENGEKDSDRIKAATEILDRGYGKPLAATIALPVPKRIASQLYAMSDEELIAEIRGGAAALPDRTLTFEDALNTLPSLNDPSHARLPELVDPEDPLLE